MNPTTIVTIVSLVSLGLVTGCSKHEEPPPSTQLSGQVFLQTNGGPLKLAAVRVYALPATAYVPPIMKGQPSLETTPETMKYWDFLDAKIARLDRQIIEQGGKPYAYPGQEHAVNMPPVLCSTVTDADGRFKLKVPGSEPFQVFAEVYRNLNEDEAQIDQWLIKSTEIEDKDNLLLQNGNLTLVNGAKPKT